MVGNILTTEGGEFGHENNNDGFKLTLNILTTEGGELAMKITIMVLSF